MKHFDCIIYTNKTFEEAKALSVNAEILVFDEPTSALTTRETEELFRVILDLKKRYNERISFVKLLGP